MVRFSRTLRALAFAVTLASVSVADVWAQAPRPSTAEPGRTDRLRAAPERPAVSAEPIISVGGDREKSNLQDGVTFVLNKVNIENATVFTAQELEVVYKDYIGQNVGIATLNEIADTITAYYRNEGYVLSRAVLAPQSIKNGVVIFRIIEGTVDQVLIQGHKGSSALIEKYSQKIKESKPLNVGVLERYLLLMEDLPGVTARAVLRPSANVLGASDVIITLSEKAVDAAFSVDNRGTRYMGPYQGSVMLSANNMLGGLYEKTQVRFLNTANVDELHYGELRHEEPLDSEGTKLALSAAVTRSDAGHTLKSFSVIGDDVLLSAEVSHPFIRSREKNLYGSVQYDHRNTKVETLGADLYEDVLNVFRAGGAYDVVDGLSGVSRLDMKLSQGVGWDDDSSTGSRSRATGHTHFMKVNAEANRLQPITSNLSVFMAATGQLSNRSLLSSEQFSVGGANYGSAFDPSEISGDSGVSGRVELQFSDYDRVVYIPSYQVYSFYDAGKAVTRNPTAGQKSDQSLTSTGVGLRFNTNTPLTGGLEFSVPLTRDVAANGGDGAAPRVFFNLDYRY
jgi:hemolysin activation/secretion protein